MKKKNTLRYLQGPLMYIALLLIIMLVVRFMGTPDTHESLTLSYSELLTWVENDLRHDLGESADSTKTLQDIQILDNELVGRVENSTISNKDFGSYSDIDCVIPSETQFYDDVNRIYTGVLGREVSPTEYRFTITAVAAQGTPWWIEWVPLLVTMVLFGALWFFLLRQQGGGGGKGMMNFGKAQARVNDPSKNKVTFADVAGAEEEKAEMQELVEFLKNPKKFTDIGARIPKGVLLVGPPGTGKTLMARAVAGEAGVPFYSISGSDFVEMFVGVGASRVRDLFETGKKNAPSIIFIDEIDAVGRQRGAGLGGGHDEREQTLNQMLVEMDGFANNSGVIVIAATNRADILDPALTRPGRFDRQITVGYPDIRGRKEILEVHKRIRDFKTAPDVDFDVIAKLTPYNTGADLENILNEAAILAARDGLKEVPQQYIIDAVSRVGLGPEKKSHKISEKDKRLVAVHEAGHAVVSHFMPDHDPVKEVSIIPRGGAGGYTWYMPEEETSFATSKYLKSNLCSLLGGHCAERLVLGDVSMGSTSDLKRATQIARSMVTQYGMSDKLGPIFLNGEQEVFLGKSFSQSNSDISDVLATEIDREMQRFLNEAMEKTNSVLTEHRAELDRLADKLIELEKINREQFLEIMNPPAQAETEIAE